MPDAMPAGGTGEPTPALGGLRVALLEGRMGTELSRLVMRHGGVPVHAPAVREIPIDASAVVGRLVDALESGQVDTVVFLTGVGVETLLREAERVGRRQELEDGLRRTTTVVRGQKPRAALRRHGLPISLMVDEPYTTTEVIDALLRLNLRQRGIALIHYGEQSDAIGDALRAAGSRVLDVSVYAWGLPEDTTGLERLVEKIIAGDVDAVAFTSQVQIRHLLLVSTRIGRTLKLLNALNEGVVVAAVGPTCAEALRAVGVPPHVVPANPKMGPMVVALAEHAARGRPIVPPTRC